MKVNKSFSNESLEESKLILKTKKTIKNSNYVDLTSLKTYSIDDSSTFEIDDAISISSESGKIQIFIHISSPSEYINFDSYLDIEARKRSTSIYLADKTITMFPEDIIRNLLSLRTNNENLAFTAKIELNGDGSINNYKIFKSKVTVTYQLTYEDAEELIDLAPREEDELTTLYNILKKRQLFRMNEGAINIEETQGRLKSINDDIKLYFIEPSKSRFIISESMLLIGTVVADYASINNINLPYRGQDYVKDRNSLKRGFNESSLTFNNRLKASLSKSYISTKPVKHASLGLNRYVQFTSPIRRYIDLLAHYQINNHLEQDNEISLKNIDLICNEFSYNQKQNQDIYNQNRIECLVKYFNKNESKVYTVFILKCINNLNCIVQANFINLHMNVIIQVKGLSYNSLNNKFDVNFLKYDEERLIIVFGLL